MRTFGIVMSGVSALLSLALAIAIGRRPRAPRTCRTISRRSSAPRRRARPRSAPRTSCSSTPPCSSSTANAAQIFKKNILAEHPVILGLFSGAGGRFILYRPGMAPLEAPSVPIVYQLLKSVGHSTMALAEVVVPYLNSPNDLTWRGPLARLPEPHAIRPRRSRCGAHARRLEADQPRDPREQHRVHGRGPEGERDLARGPAGVRQEAGAALEEEHRLGGSDPGRALDGRDRRLEADARRRLGQDLCGEQHDLCRPPEQCPVQRARPVLPAGGDQRSADADRDDLLHHDAGRHARLAHPHHRRPLRRRGVLRRLSSDGLRIDGRRRASRRSSTRTRSATSR